MRSGPERKQAGAFPWFGVAWTVALGAVLVGGWAVGTLPAGCPGNFHITLALTGSGEAVTSYLNERCQDVGLSAALGALAVDLPFAAAYGALGFAGLWRWWPQAWRTTLLHERLRWVIWLPVAAAAMDVLENAVLIGGLLVASEGDALAVGEWAAVLASAFGWWKFLLVGLSFLALVTAALGMVGYHKMGRLPPDGQLDEHPPLTVTPHKDVTGICLSGGGIRSASFALGGLQGLDENGMFTRARYLSAVSGGSYTAVAWRIARATGQEAAQVHPPLEEEHDGILAPTEGAAGATEGEGSPDLHSHIRTHRRYLATGRGGLPLSALIAVLFLVINVGVLALAVYLLAWPVGWLAASPFTGVAQDAPVRLGPYAPAGLAAAIAVLAFLRSLTLEGPRHLRALRWSGYALAAGSLMLLLLVGVPWVIANASAVRSWLDGLPLVDAERGGLYGLLAALGVTGALVRTVMKPVGKAAPRLGGLLLVVAAGIWALVVARGVVTGTWWAGPWAFGAGALLFAVVYYVANLRSWSLHTLYLAGLRSTFSTRQDVVGPERVTRSRGWGEEQSWEDYASDAMPELLVCASAQRQDRTGTGIPSVSFVFSPRQVTIYDHRVRDDGSLEIHEHATPMDRYAALLPGPFERQLTTPSAAAAISGAAVTSAMGRHHLGSTNALLAALNVRLGVWLPNPRYIAAQTEDLAPFKRTRLNYLVKEIFGIYDLREPFVYVTDGGHWENLGLVELLRRGCERIICIDASGDAPGSAATLREALVLAEVECGVTVDFGDSLKRLGPDADTGIAEDCVAVGVVRYHRQQEHVRTAGCTDQDCPSGVVLYAKAVVSRYAPDSVRAYALQDERFPAYSTADQFLGEVQFDRLVDLGRATAARAATLAACLETALEAGTEPEDEVLIPAYRELTRLRGCISPPVTEPQLSLPSSVACTPAPPLVPAVIAGFAGALALSAWMRIRRLGPRR